MAGMDHNRPERFQKPEVRRFVVELGAAAAGAEVIG
jgi:hypothetical protein